MDEDRSIDLKYLAEFEVSVFSDLPSIHVRFWQWVRLRGPTALEPAMEFLQKHDGGAFSHDQVIKYLMKRGLLGYNEKSGTLRAKSWSVTPVRKRPQKIKTTKSGKKSKLAKLTGREQIYEAFVNPRLAGSVEVIKDAVERIFRRVNDHRIKCNTSIMPATHKRKHNKRWRSFARRLVVGKAQTEEFLEFAFESFKFLKGVQYPPIANLDGEWIWEQWEDRDTKKKIIRTRHGGKSYATPSVDLRKRLVDAGFGFVTDFDDAQLRYVESEADARVNHPAFASDAGDWEPAVIWLADWIKENNDGDSGA